MANPIVHFEIEVDDIERAKKFYGDVFGWGFEDYSQYVNEAYWGVTTKNEKGEGIDGGLMKRKSPLHGSEPEAGVNAFTCTVAVDDYDSFHDKILASGGKVVKEKHALPGMAWQGYYLDTEGNSFGIHQPDENAK